MLLGKDYHMAPIGRAAEPALSQERESQRHWPEAQPDHVMPVQMLEMGASFAIIELHGLNNEAIHCPNCHKLQYLRLI